MSKDDDNMSLFESQFDQPIRIGGFGLLTDEVIEVFTHRGQIDCPIYPPEQDAEDDGSDVEAMFLLRLSPMEARNLAGMLMYAAGRADETADHCIGCGEVLDDDDKGETL